MSADLKEALRPIVAELLEEFAKRAPANDVEMLSAAEYAKRWSISITTVREAYRENRLEIVRIGRAVRIPAAARIEAPANTATERALLTLMGKSSR